MLDLMKNAKLEYRQARYDRKLQELQAATKVLNHVVQSNAKVALPPQGKKILIEAFANFGRGRK